MYNLNNFEGLLPVHSKLLHVPFLYQIIKIQNKLIFMNMMSLCAEANKIKLYAYLT